MQIFVYDEFSPEDIAMMQALYSRSGASAEDHAAKVRNTGSGKFMERYYVGYGHASIADCGSTTIFIEGVSMLAAKAIQDWPLYSGQETSSRYIDFSDQPLCDPIGSPESKKLHREWLDLYMNSRQEVLEHLRVRYPIKDGEASETYDRAIQARVFDTLRGILPAGVTTQLSWHTNLRQAHDKLEWLRHHPLEEVRSIGSAIHSALMGRYRNSFSHREYPESERFRSEVASKYTYHTDRYGLPTEGGKGGEDPSAPTFFFHSEVSSAELAPYGDILSSRPPKTGLPHFLADLGYLRFDFLLDFGSFRDIQRHRNGVCRMPLLTLDFGFEQWYLNELPETVRKRVENLLDSLPAMVQKLSAPPEVVQYYLPMGLRVPVRASYGLPAAVYTCELRSGRHVHPTLRSVAHKMHRAIVEALPTVKMHSDLDPSNWDIRRGLQDIKEL